MTRESKLVSFFFLAAVFCASFEKVQWNVAGTVFLADLTALGFLASFAFDRIGSHRLSGRVPRTAAVLLAFLGAFLLVYLIGFFNLETTQALSQFGKGIVKWLIHFAFLIVGVIYLTGRSKRYFWKTLAWFLGGIVFNGAYGILQLLSAQAGRNLDSLFLSPLTRGASQINIYGAVNGTSVYRPNALTGDPNHLGIMLLLPILILTPIYLRLEKGRLRNWLAVLIAFLLIVELATLSRSGLLGLTVGALVLLIPYRHLLFSRLAILPLALVVIPVASRSTGGGTSSTSSCARASPARRRVRTRTSTSTRSSRRSCTCTRSSASASTTSPSTTSSSRARRTGARTPTTWRCSSRAASSGPHCSRCSSGTCSHGLPLRGGWGRRSPRRVTRSPPG